MTPTGTVTLSKHEGAGNDFLVMVDRGDGARLSPDQVRVLCDRHRGVGADGFISVAVGRGADLVMELVNADGSSAEMSGNGIRCLAQAAVGAGLVPAGRCTVSTDAGVRSVELRPGQQPGLDWASVDMGVAKLGDHVANPWSGAQSQMVDVGNPHVVLLGDDPAQAEVTSLGPAVERSHPGGANVEFVAVAGPDRLALRVWERGVGETLACGTGSVAAAAAAHSWGLVGSRVAVGNPGGTLEVVLSGGDGPAFLAGPVRKVADVLVDVAVLR